MGLFDTRPSVDELKEVARGLHAGQIFTDRHVANPQSDMTMVFMPLALGALSECSKEDVEQIGMIYEWIDKAGPRSVNGMPCFMSFKLLHRDDAVKVLKMYQALRETADQALDRVANEV